MPPKERFSFEKVLETAFDILRKSGWSCVTARAIAKALKASTMPVYSAIGSMKRLENALKSRAYTMLADFQTRPHTPNPILNMAVGQVLLSRDEPHVYRFLHIDSPVPLGSAARKTFDLEIEKRLGKPLPFSAYLDPHALARLDTISLKAWIFTHGLSMALMNGLIRGLGEKEIITLLEEAGGAFVMWESSLKNKKARSRT